MSKLIETFEEELLTDNQTLNVFGAREHNLKNIDVVIPRNKLIVVTGLSGSGKSSLAFDVIYAEGQRRYLETFSAYARQFLGSLERPDVDKIEGLNPVISIEQKSVNKNPRSTVGTVTEIYDFLRLLYARVADAYSYKTGKIMKKFSDKELIDLVIEKFWYKRIVVLSPLVKARKGHYKELFEKIQKMGFIKVRVDGQIKDITYGLKLDRYKIHSIEIVIDRIKVERDESSSKRIAQSLQYAMKQGKGSLMILDEETNEIHYFSRSLMDMESGLSYEEPEPNTFSFNSAYGACPRCNGLGEITEADLQSIIPDKTKTLRHGGIVPLGSYKNSWIFHAVESIGKKHGFTLDTRIEDISESALNIILYGSDELIKINYGFTAGINENYSMNFEGIINFITGQMNDTMPKSVKTWATKFMNSVVCPECHGKRLKQDALCFKIADKNIAELSSMDMLNLYQWFSNIDDVLDNRKRKIAHEIVRELKLRIQFLLNVGLDYLSLNRSSKSLSGGESQRIRLATQIGSRLTNVLYILDEPSIGLHQKDNVRLIDALKDLRDIGNSVIVAEHDHDLIMASDYIVDLGPGAGRLGGKVVAHGHPRDFLKLDSLTAKYLNGEKKIIIPEIRRKGTGKFIELKGASGNNLKNVDLVLPLGMLVCVTGVSGSGKSSLINETLYRLLTNRFYRSHQQPLAYKQFLGIEHIDKVIDVDQSPIGRTPRSNPATYISVFGDIRDLFSSLPESKVRGYKPGRFSFNVSGGRCETCGGAGVKTIEMNFLPDVYVHCDDCNGKRYNRETLEVRYKGKSINDVLNLTVDEAVDFFEQIPSIRYKVKSLQDVGLGYITLGQKSTTLSGGEAQRVKLATELTKRDTGNTLYILDEPTTGLHFEDVRVLLGVLNHLVDKGNTVVVIEHNLDVIKTADYIIDLGPEGGERGGEIVCCGSPEEIIKNEKSFTAYYLKKILSQ